MKKKILYEISISILAIIAVSFAILDITNGLSSWQTSLDYMILFVFIFDYFVRLYASKSKKDFVRSNILDLIAIIPFNSAFRIFRVFKFVKLTRLLKITKLTKLFHFHLPWRDSNPLCGKYVFF